MNHDRRKFVLKALFTFFMLERIIIIGWKMTLFTWKETHKQCNFAKKPIIKLFYMKWYLHGGRFLDGKKKKVETFTSTVRKINENVFFVFRILIRTARITVWSSPSTMGRDAMEMSRWTGPTAAPPTTPSTPERCRTVHIDGEKHPLRQGSDPGAMRYHQHSKRSIESLSPLRN